MRTLLVGRAAPCTITSITLSLLACWSLGNLEYCWQEYYGIGFEQSDNVAMGLHVRASAGGAEAGAGCGVGTSSRLEGRDGVMVNEQWTFGVLFTVSGISKSVPTSFFAA